MDNSGSNNTFPSSNLAELFQQANLRHNKTTLKEKETTIMKELQIMSHQEEEEFGSKNHQTIDMNVVINEDLRQKICKWAFEVIDYFGYDREIVAIALYFLDRVVRKQNKANSQREFQLIATTCLYISIQLYGCNDDDSLVHNDNKIRKIQTIFVKLSGGKFSIETLEGKKFEVLQILECDRMNTPPIIPIRFAEISLRLLLLSTKWNVEDNDKKTHCIFIIDSLYEIARYLTELALCNSSTFSYKPSAVAYACILCAFDILQQKRQRTTTALHNSSIITSLRAQFIKSVSIWTHNNDNLTPKNVAPIQRLLRKQYSAGMFVVTNNNNENVKSSRRRNTVCTQVTKSTNIK